MPSSTVESRHAPVPSGEPIEPAPASALPDPSPISIQLVCAPIFVLVALPIAAPEDVTSSSADVKREEKGDARYAVKAVGNYIFLISVMR